MVAIATIGLCYLTETVARWFGIELPEQANILIVRKCLANAFVSAKAFFSAALLVVQVILVMPAIEECIFRLPTRWLRHWSVAVVSSVLFSAAHYITQPWPDAAFISLLFFGLAQCWIYRKTGRIWCVMLNHALFNLTNLILLILLPESVA